MSSSSQRLYSAEEAYAFLAEDSESVSDSDEEFTAFSLSGSSESSSADEGPARRRPRRSEEVTPQSSDPLWTPAPDSYQPQIPNFVATPGVRFDTTGLSELDFFKIFFSEDLVDVIVTQTNLYAQQFLALNPTSTFCTWTPVNAAEMMTFWGLLLHMGIVKKPSIRQYWSTDVFYSTPFYRHSMTRKRFEVIHKFLHYADNSLCPPRDDPTYDRLFKVRPLITHFSAKFSAVYTPEKFICVDESLLHFKGRLKFRQYLPSKRARYGVKIYKMCESTSGYTLSFRIYEGKDSQIVPPECPPSLKISGKIVWDLVHPLLDKGYHLYVDNFYTSIPLFKCLSCRRTAACGTVRKNQRGLPKPFVAQLLPRGESRSQSSGDLLLVKYKDKRDVLVLTTCHGPSTTPAPVRGTSSTVAYKPDCILDYNRYMGGVDLSDQVLKPYSATRKTRVWYKKLSVHLVQMAMYNAFILFRFTGQAGTFITFQEKVIKALVFGNQGEGPSTSGSDVPRIVPGQHFPNEIPSTGKKGRTQKKCRVCYKRGMRKDTTYHCETCPDKPGLCMKECFKLYHSSMDY